MKRSSPLPKHPGSSGAPCRSPSPASSACSTSSKVAWRRESPIRHSPHCSHARVSASSSSVTTSNSIASAAPPQSVIRRTLETSPGFERAASLGPRIGEPGGRTWTVDGGAGGPRPAIEIYEVAGASVQATLLTAAGAVRSNGSSDLLASLVDGGLPTTTPVLFGTDGQHLDLDDEVIVATDGVRRQQDSFGGPFRRSRTLAASEPFEGDRRVFDFLPDGVSTLSTFRLLGVASVAASSSGAEVRTVFNSEPVVRPVVGSRLRP